MGRFYRIASQDNITHTTLLLTHPSPPSSTYLICRHGIHPRPSHGCPSRCLCLLPPPCCGRLVEDSGGVRPWPRWPLEIFLRQGCSVHHLEERPELGRWLPHRRRRGPRERG